MSTIGLIAVDDRRLTVEQGIAQLRRWFKL